MYHLLVLHYPHACASTGVQTSNICRYGVFMCLLRRIEPQTKTMLPDKDGPAVGGGQTSEKEDPSVSLFREYLRLRTVHPEPDYGETPFPLH